MVPKRKPKSELPSRIQVRWQGRPQHVEVEGSRQRIRVWKVWCVFRGVEGDDGVSEGGAAQGQDQWIAW